VIVFFYKRAFDLPIADDLEAIRSKKPVRFPVVLSQTEVTRILSAMTSSLILGLSFSDIPMWTVVDDQ